MKNNRKNKKMSKKMMERMLMTKDERIVELQKDVDEIQEEAEKAYCMAEKSNALLKEAEEQLKEGEEQLREAEAFVEAAQDMVDESTAVAEEATKVAKNAIMKGIETKEELDKYIELDNEEFGGSLKQIMGFFEKLSNDYDCSTESKELVDAEKLYRLAEENGLSTNSIKTDQWQYALGKKQAREKELRNMFSKVVGDCCEGLKEIMKKN